MSETPEKPGATKAPGPSRARRRSRTAPLVLVAAAVLLVVAVVAALSTLRTPPADQAATTARPPSTAPTTTSAPATSAASEASSPVTTATTAASTSAAPAPARTATPTPRATGTASATGTPRASAPATTPAANAAVAQLQAIAARNQGVRPRSGQVIVHLQNRPVGMAAGAGGDTVRPPSGGATWTAADILSDHNTAAARAGGATLWQAPSGNWVTATWNPSWTTAEQAKRWCELAFGQDVGAPSYDSSVALRSRCFVTQY